ncbi:MAG: hypothetical protein K2J67_10935 [Lachnospiraceae bacterium]|nr:hypothetical protein [Lachnospiraceae bacterium]
MKMKLKELMVLNHVLKNLIDHDTDRKIQTLFKFKILGILKNMETPIANFEIIRNEKIKEYGTEKEDGTISIPEDNEEIMQQFTDDLNDLMESEVEIPLEKLKMEEVFSAGVSADYLVGLYGIIEE